MTSIYRVTIDEHGQEDCRDYTDRLEAMVAFKAATRRKTVLSVDVYKCAPGREPVLKAQWQDGKGDWI